MPDRPTGCRVFYMPRKLEIREDAATKKVRMVFDAKVKPRYLANSVVSMTACTEDHPYSHLCGIQIILIREKMSTDILLGDVGRAFLQIGVKEDDRDTFRFLFKVTGHTRGTLPAHTATFPRRGKPIHTRSHLTASLQPKEGPEKRFKRFETPMWIT